MFIGAKSPCESSSTNEVMDGDKTSKEQMEANLDAMIQIELYDPFEVLAQQRVHAKGASTLRPT
jgi:hypothetical protein